MEPRRPQAYSTRSHLSQSSASPNDNFGQAANFPSDARYRSPPPSYSSPPPPSYSSTTMTGRQSDGTEHVSRREIFESNIPAGSSRVYNPPHLSSFSSSRHSLPSQSTQGSSTSNPAHAQVSRPLRRQPPLGGNNYYSSTPITDIVAAPWDFSNVPLFEPSRPVTPPSPNDRRILPRPAHSLQDQQRRRQQRLQRQQQQQQSSLSPRTPTDEELLRAPKLVPKDLPYVGDSPGEIPSPPVTPPRRDSVTQNPYPTPALSDEEDVPGDGLGLFAASLRHRRFATRR